MTRRATGKGHPNNRLTIEQRIAVYKWLGDGKTAVELRKLAAKFNPPFTLTDQTCVLYRKRMRAKYDNLVENAELPALTEGLAKSEERVKVLKALAERLMTDLLRKHNMSGEEFVWLKRLKGYGQGPQFFTQEYLEFNAGEIRELRGLLEDIAKETGGRTQAGDSTEKHKVEIEVVYANRRKSDSDSSDTAQ